MFGDDLGFIFEGFFDGFIFKIEVVIELFLVIFLFFINILCRIFESVFKFLFDNLSFWLIEVFFFFCFVCKGG